MQNNIESGIQLFSRVTRKTFLNGINNHFFPDGGPFPNQVLEITGDPSIDKNDLLLDFLVKCILPNKYKDEWKSSAAILINTDFQINLLKIIKIIETFIKKESVNEYKKEIIESALKNLIILNCYNLDQLEITFYNLEKIIHNNENISLVIIDNIAAQYWLSKSDMHMLSYYQHSQKIFDTLYNIVRNLQVLFIFVRHQRAATKKKFSHKVDITIQLGKTDTNFIATVTNYEKCTSLCVPFILNTVLEFLR